MKAILRGVSGPGTGVEIELDRGISVGRSQTSSVSIPGDRFLSGLHFEVLPADGRLLLRDARSSNGTFVNGSRIREHVLMDGDSICAGESAFQVEFGAAPMPSLVEVLSGASEPLYAVLDAARDPAIYPMLVTGGARYTSLFAGKSALELEMVAPYLVYLQPHCELLQQIVAQGWGKSWGIFLHSREPIEAVWHELRRSLMVVMDETQKHVFFRFYDPRVLRLFLPVADAQQKAEFFGTISHFLLEDESPDGLLCFHSLVRNHEVERWPVSRPAAATGELPPAPSEKIASPSDGLR